MNKTSSNKSNITQLPTAQQFSNFEIVEDAYNKIKNLKLEPNSVVTKNYDETTKDRFVISIVSDQAGEILFFIDDDSIEKPDYILFTGANGKVQTNLVYFDTSPATKTTAKTLDIAPTYETSIENAINEAGIDMTDEYTSNLAYSLSNLKKFTQNGGMNLYSVRAEKEPGNDKIYVTFDCGESYTVDTKEYMSPSFLMSRMFYPNAIKLSEQNSIRLTCVLYLNEAPLSPEVIMLYLSSLPDGPVEINPQRFKIMDAAAQVLKENAFEDDLDIDFDINKVDPRYGHIKITGKSLTFKDPTRVITALSVADGLEFEVNVDDNITLTLDCPELHI